MVRLPGARSRAVADASRTSGARASESGILVFVIAAVRLYREGIARLVREDASLRLAGLGAPDEQSLLKIARDKPRVVVVDARDGCKAGFVRRLATAAHGCGLIAIGIREEEKEVIDCAEAGVGGYLERDAPATELTQAVRELANGEFHCPPRIAAILFRKVGAVASRDRAATALSHLTKRE